MQKGVVFILLGALVSGNIWQLSAGHITFINKNERKTDDSIEGIEVCIYPEISSMVNESPASKLIYTVLPGQSFTIYLNAKDLAGAKKFSVKGSQKGVFLRWDTLESCYAFYSLDHDYTITFNKGKVGVVPNVHEEEKKRS
jgi:hypothetical protein